MNACFFGFLRSDEACAPSPNSYDPTWHLCLGDLAIDSHTCPTKAFLNIKASKTDPFRQGVTIMYIGKDQPTVMSPGSTSTIRSPSWLTTRSTVSVHRWGIPYKGKICERDKAATSGYKCRPLAILRTQFQDRSCNYSSTSWPGRCSYPDTGTLEKFSVSNLYKDSQRVLGHSFPSHGIGQLALHATHTIV